MYSIVRNFGENLKGKIWTIYYPTNPVSIEYWKTQNILLKTFTSKAMASAFLKGWCKHVNPNPNIVNVSVVDDGSGEGEVDSQETQE